MTTTKRLVSITAAEVTPETAKFAWAGRVPLGELTILAGPPGQGKTQLALGAGARATRGKLDGDLFGTPADVLYISAEDSLEHTLTPRAIAAGGDLGRVHFFETIAATSYHGEEERPGFLIPDDVPLLDEWLKNHPAARIVVLDPIVAMIPASLNTHRDQHVRRALSPLAHVAQERSAAVIGIMHLNKDREADALNRLSGSIGFGGAARSVLLFALDPDDPDGEAGNRRVLAHVKCNVGPRKPSIAYRIEPRTIETSNGPVSTSVAVRDGNAAVSANDLLGSPTSSSEATARGEAREFLQIELGAGPVKTLDLKTRADDAGISWRTIERAKQQLAIRAKKNGVGWLWELPTIPNTPPGGLDGVGGDEEGRPPSPPTLGLKSELADIDPDAELERLQAKFGPLETAA